MSKDTKQVAVIAVNLHEAEAYIFHHSLGAGSAFTVIDKQRFFNGLLQFDEIRLVGSWYANPSLCRCYLEARSVLKPGGTVTVVS